MRFEYVTALAEYIAERLSIHERKNCVPSTLLRNSRYRSKLDDYIDSPQNGKKRGGATAAVRGQTARPLEAKQEELQVANLRRENERLRLYNATLEKTVSGFKQQAQRIAGKPEVAQSESVAGISAESVYERKFVMTCHVLGRVLDQLPAILRVDLEAGRIIDKSDRRNGLIAEGDMAEPFIEWRKQSKRRSA
jgi:hypothetical protein